MPWLREQACPKMNRLNFQVRFKTCDNPLLQRIDASMWLKASTIAALLIGAIVIGAMLNDSDATEYLRAIAAR
jgi:ABC-type uncharacterized transport system permease subunit